MKIRKSSSWWDTFLWLGIFLLVVIFLYQLLKLWQAGQATLSNAGNAIGQAFTNSVAAVENGLSSLVTNPLDLVTTLFGLAPSFLSLVFSFFSSLVLGDFLTDVITFVTNIFGGLTAAPIVSGSGSTSTSSGASDPTGGGNNLNPGSGFTATMTSQ
jgi:hypothetical protein